MYNYKCMYYNIFLHRVTIASGLQWFSNAIIAEAPCCALLLRQVEEPRHYFHARNIQGRILFLCCAKTKKKILVYRVISCGLSCYIVLYCVHQCWSQETMGANMRLGARYVEFTNPENSLASSLYGSSAQRHFFEWYRATPRHIESVQIYANMIKYDRNNINNCQLL